jgi:hypothetical protein
MQLHRNTFFALVCHKAKRTAWPATSALIEPTPVD